MCTWQAFWSAFLLTALAPPAWADRFGPWYFPVPEGYERNVAPALVTYTGRIATFAFHNPVASNGEMPKKLGPELIEEQLASPPSEQQLLQAADLGDGRNFAMYMVETEDGLRIASVFTDGEQAGLVTLSLPGAGLLTGSEDISEERAALLATEFHETKPSDPLVPSALPKVDWPEPLPGFDATTRLSVTLREAVGKGLKPDEAPLPVRFLCYRKDEQRAMAATPDLEFTFGEDGTYTVSNGQRSGSGTWRVERDETVGIVVRWDGTMAFNGTMFIWQGFGFGQGFSTEDPFADSVRVVCHQDGPRVERTQQAMARVAVERLLMNCVDAEGNPFRFMFGEGAYKAPEGSGRMHVNLLGNGQENWRAVLNFQTGPYSLFVGKLSADGAGNLRLSLESEWHTEVGWYYSSTQTTRHATCTGSSTRRLLPVYGLDMAPPAKYPAGGLPEGVFRSFEPHRYWTGIEYLDDWRDTLTYVAPGGRIVRDVNMNHLGGLPDCTKSRPDGFGFCGEYRVDGNTVSFLNSGDWKDDGWSEPAILRLTDTGFRIGNVDYALLQPLETDFLTGDWSGSSYTASGDSVTGVYHDAEIHWSFGTDGRFEWRESVTTETIIPGDANIDWWPSGGGTSSFADGGTGAYEFDGSWLTLTFDDGRSKRLFVLGGSRDKSTIKLGGNELKTGLEP